jgi:hypothetical protein
MLIVLDHYFDKIIVYTRNDISPNTALNFIPLQPYNILGSVERISLLTRPLSESFCKIAGQHCSQALKDPVVLGL